MPPTYRLRYARDDSNSTASANNQDSNSDHHSGPNAGLIAGVVTASAVVLFLIVVVVVPILKRRRQRAPPPPTTVEQFLGKDSTFNSQAPGDIAAILDHLSYLPGNDTVPPKESRRRSLILGTPRGNSSRNSGSNQRRQSGSHNTRQRGNNYQRESQMIIEQRRSYLPGSNNRQSGYTNRQSVYDNRRSFYSRDERESWDRSYYYEEDEKDNQRSVPAIRRDSPPLDEYSPSLHSNPFTVPASAPAAVSTSHNLANIRPLDIRSRTAKSAAPRHQNRSPGSESDYSQSSDSDDGYPHERSPRPSPRVNSGKENKQNVREVGDILKSRFSRDTYAPRPDSFALSAPPRSKRNRAPPLSKSSGLASPAPRSAPRSTMMAMPLDSLPEVPNSSIAVGFSLPDSPNDLVVVTPAPDQGFDLPSAGPRTGNDPFHHVPLTPRTPRSPLREVYTSHLEPRSPHTGRRPQPETPRTPAPQYLEPGTPRTPRTPLREVFTPRTPHRDAFETRTPRTPLTPRTPHDVSN